MKTTDKQLLYSRDGDYGEDAQDMTLAKRGCCLWMPCLGSTGPSADESPWWEQIRTAEKEERWWTRGWRALKKLRVWSEIIAGPKWKTFSRRFNKNRSGVLRQRTFHYDPLSYALNFDEGPSKNGLLDDDTAYRDFSFRYASIPASAKTSMDLGRDGPSFT